MSSPRDKVQRTSIAKVLSNRNYGPFFVGNFISNSGTWLQNIAQVLLVYRLTHSPFWVGVVNFAQFAAILFLAPAAGSAADRFDRRRLVIAAQLFSATLAGFLCLITAAGHVNSALVILVALLLGGAHAATAPALQAMVPSLVARADLHAAIAMTNLTYNLARTIGPVVGVIAISQWGLAAAFGVNALSYLTLAAALLATKPPQIDQLVGRVGTRLRESLLYVRARSDLYAPLIVVGLIAISTDPVNTLTPAFSTEVLGVLDTFTGYLVGAFGMGAVSAAILTSRLRPTHPTTGAMLLLTGAGIVSFALSTSRLMALGSLFVAGFGYLSSVTSATSILHANLEDGHRGRVMALWTLCFLGMRPIASVVDGGLASMVGIEVAGIIMALPAIVGGLWLGVVGPRSRASHQLPQDPTAPADD